MMWTVNDGNDSVYRIVNTIAGIVWHIFDIISDENNKNDRKYDYKQLTQKQIGFDQIDEEESDYHIEDCGDATDHYSLANHSDQSDHVIGDNAEEY